MDPTLTLIQIIQTGGLVSFLSLAVIAFARGWVYAAAIVEDLRSQVKELTAALKSANAGMEQMADAWENRNNLEAQRDRDRQEWDRRNAGGKP
jgi:uncharacterized protein (DUF3084 family)